MYKYDKYRPDDAHGRERFVFDTILCLGRGVDANVVDNGVSITHSRRDSNGTRDASRDSQKQ